ncbi:MAG: DUF1553 domain-containing protein [Acidobacteria bacterium]|nr:DUF1553 domain-containing protein [Acidobacteriota bacterium]
MSSAGVIKGKVITAAAGVFAAALAIIAFSPETASGYAEESSFGDCPFYASHESLYVSNNSREINKIAVRLKGVPAVVQPGVKAQPHNLVDRHIFDKMGRDGVNPAPLSSDEEFLRRATLDATGRIPSADDVRNFLGNGDPAKRDSLIERLVASPEYVDRWSNFLGDLVKEIGNSTQINLSVQGRNAWYDFIHDSLKANKPYNQFAAEMITATGNNWDDGAANFIQRWRQGNGPAQDTFDNLAAAVGSSFLGLSLECLSCHDGAGHTNSINLFLTSKTRRDFWGMAAHFSRITFPAAERVPDPVNPKVLYNRFLIKETASGDYRLNTTTGNKTPRRPLAGEPNIATPRFILTNEAPATGEPYRVALARQLSSKPGNRQFARATVNYIWKELFGIGIVEPAENFDLLRLDPGSALPGDWSVQPTHPELLEALADEFINTNFDFQRMVKLLLQSSTYQLSSRYEGEWSDAYIPYFARKFPRRLKAEELHDAIVQATNVAPNPLFEVQFKTDKTPWAMQLPDTSEPRNNGSSRVFMDVFLRGNRDSVMRSGESSLAQELNMMNNTFVTSRISRNSPTSTVARVLKGISTPLDRINELYLATLSRRPTPEEQADAIGYITKGAITTRLEDLQFVLLNKVDFIFNY